ncbi:MAG: lysophospholipid acyltransferase family protein, partial [Alphaproteobacteria bacterium]
MQFQKRLMKLDFVQRLLGALIAFYVFLVYRTSRWSVEGREHPQPFWDSDKNFIVCFWHGRMLMLPYAWECKRPYTQLNSGHRDGIVSIRAQAHFGVRTVVGSATIGAVKAFRGLLKTVLSGETIGITPDGPHGPRMRAKPGIVTIASKAGVPILPLAFSAKRCSILDSWDRFVLPYPFTRGHFVWGEP